MAENETAQALREPRYRPSAAAGGSAELFHAVLQAATEYSIIGTDPFGTITVFNHGAERMLGYAAEEMIGLQTPATIHDAAEVAARAAELGIEPGFEVFVHAARRFEPEVREWTYIRRDGTRLPVSLTVTAIRSEAGGVAGFIGIARDITERERGEQALRDSEERFRRLADSTFEAVGITENGRIVDVNRAFLDLMRCDEAQALGRSAADFSHPDDVARVRHMVANGIETPYETRCVRPDGTVFPAEIRGRMVREAGRTIRITALRDLTERKRAEAELRAQETRYRALVEAASDIIFAADRDGHFTYVNPVAESVVGYPRVELVGMHFTQLVAPEARDDVAAHYARQLADRAPSSYLEFPVVRQDGRTIWIGQNVRLLERDGAFAGFQAVARDISERREIDRMKDEFVGLVSHELRSPLTSVLGSLELVASGRLGDEQQSRMISIAADNARRLLRLVNDFLDLERLNSGEITLNRQETDILHVMAQSADAIRALAADAGVAIEQDPISASLSADPDRIIQVLVNLLSNAIKFSEPGSSVTLRAEPHDGGVRIDVADRGRGIPADKVETIFGRFQQVDRSDSRSKGGTGLGLAICQTIVDQHHGRIWVDSQLGRGSTFHVWLPRT